MSNTKSTPFVEQIADECFDNISSFIPEWRDNLEPKKWIRHFIQAAIEKREAQIMATLAQSNVKAAQPQPPLVEQIAQQFETRLENQGYLGITDKTPPEVAARIRRHALRVENALLNAKLKAAQPQRCDTICGCQDGEDCHICREPASCVASGTPTACSPGRVAGSEPQEQWTVERIGFVDDQPFGRIMYGNVAGAEMLESTALDVAAAHKTALAAAKYGTPELARRVTDLTLENNQLYKRTEKAEQELAAERQKREQAEHSAKAWEDDSRAGKEIQKGLHAELLAAIFGSYRRSP